MAHAAVKEGLRSVAAGLLTPFDDHLEVDHDALRENARIVYDEGIRTFLACANISEYHSLSHEERIEVTATSVETLPDDATVLAGVGGATPTAIDLASKFDEIGVDAMMVMPPTHTYVHEHGLLDYYRKLGDATDAPLVPYVRGFDPSVEFLSNLTELDDVVGVKYALEDVPKFAEAVASSDDVVWVDGMAEPYALALWAEGAEGFTAGVSNFEPRIGLALFDALKHGDWERAREIRAVCLPFQNFRSGTGTGNTLPGAVSVPAVKHGMELAGMTGGRVREPIVELTEEEKEQVEALYRKVESFETESV
ncbi:dihydrodipicolinate synthase family protein [Halorussus salinisoli]|uniref:dihydrodipicolinate synthase family protein n=1 Tax=Halorussus salinisoli TaxID=2558242 RepID=UPI0010C165CD|nr:dihydrodipicolinate synthase family protein [Halorussus salinisoli]